MNPAMKCMKLDFMLLKPYAKSVLLVVKMMVHWSSSRRIRSAIRIPEASPFKIGRAHV